MTVMRLVRVAFPSAVISQLLTFDPPKNPSETCRNCTGIKFFKPTLE